MEPISSSNIAESPEARYDRLKAEHERLSKRAQGLFRKHKKALGAKKSLVPLKQPVVLFMHPDGVYRVYEGHRGPYFNIEIDKKNMRYPTPPAALRDIAYGSHAIKAFVLSYCDAVPHGMDIKWAADIFSDIIQQLLINYDKLKEAKSAKQLTGWSKILLAVAAIILAYFIGKMLLGNQAPAKTAEDIMVIKSGLGLLWLSVAERIK